MRYFPDSLERVDVVLRPNVQLVESALKSTDVVWGEELVYEDVPVVRD